MPRLEPGDKAPDFTIKDLEGKHHRLYDYLNGQKKTVLLFYRGEWCPICNLQLHSFQEKLAEFQKENAQIVAVSTDTPENSQKLAGKHDLVLSCGNSRHIFGAGLYTPGLNLGYRNNYTQHTHNADAGLSILTLNYATRH